MTIKTFITLQKISISNKCCSFELSIHLWILKNKMYHSFHKNIVLFSTLIIIRNVSWAANQHIRWFWRSGDTEDWSNDAENTALITEINYSLQIFTQKTAISNTNNISQFWLYFWLNKCSLVSRRDFFRKNHNYSKLLTG